MSGTAASLLLPRITSRLDATESRGVGCSFSPTPDPSASLRLVAAAATTEQLALGAADFCFDPIASRLVAVGPTRARMPAHWNQRQSANHQQQHRTVVSVRLSSGAGDALAVAGDPGAGSWFWSRTACRFRR